MRVPIVVLISGTGTNLQAILDATNNPAYPAEVVAVGTDKPDATGLARAERNGVPTFAVALEKGADRATWDKQFAAEIDRYQPEWVVTAGFMRLLGPAVLSAYPNRVVNTHPALLPSFPGAHAVRDAINYGVRVTGSTVHLVDAGVDTGPVIAQQAVEILDGDDEESLHERIKIVERQLLVDVIARLCTSSVEVSGRKVFLK